MKNISRHMHFAGRIDSLSAFLVVVFCLLTTTTPLPAQRIQTNKPSGRDVYSFAISGTYLFAGTNGGGIWRRPLSEMITSVERLSTKLPTNFSLGQNYPNPFNPSTTISFSVPLKVFVSLKVFDALGREVSSLVSEELSAGKYSKQWSAVGLAGGIYFYRLQAGNFVETRKILLLR